MAVPTPIGEQLSILAVDLTLRATMPMFYGPKSGEPTDGNVPPGFPVVAEVAAAHAPTLRGSLTDAEWRAYLSMSGAAVEDSGAPTVVLRGVVDQSEEGGA